MGMSRAREQRGLTGKVGSDLGRLVHARATAGPGSLPTSLPSLRSYLVKVS
jgi:hypothetical protein